MGFPVSNELEENETLQLDEQKRETVHRFEQCFHRNHRYCDCAIPMTQKKWNEALGTFVVLRLCCMARSLEKLTGIPMMEVFDFPPGWVWDCDELHQCETEGTVTMKPRGVPPQWLQDRMKAKGIEIKNMPGGE
jgi:hypothetical protein